MESKFNFNNIIVLDIANNHQGSLEHGLRIIRETSAVVKKFTDFRVVFKFQFRQLDSFIHKDHKKNLDHKMVKRFTETRLERKDFEVLLSEIRNLGHYSACTPFDEESVGVIEDIYGLVFVEAQIMKIVWVFCLLFLILIV